MGVTDSPKCQSTILALNAILIGHYLVAIILWVILVFVTIAPFYRTQPALVAFEESAKWALYFLSRIWKSAMPLMLCLYSLHIRRRNSQLALWIAFASVLFTCGMASWDVWTDQWDYHTLSPDNGLRCDYFLNWWWCSHCY